jgi:hypothetical protein
VGLDRIADDDNGAVLQACRGWSIDRIDVWHLDIRLRPEARLPLRMQLPQFANQLTAERVAGAEPADSGVRPRSLIDPTLEPLELVEVGARRTRQPSDRR